MNYGICDLAMMPLRSEDSHASEMVSQLLFNEVYEVLEVKPEWIHVKTDLDQYEGWIQSKQHHALSEEDYNLLRNKRKYYTNKPIVEYKGRFLSLGTPLFEPYPDALEPPMVFQPSLMLEYGMKLLNAPYLWGGRTVFGIDCSGFVQLCARAAGKQLPRDASEQVKEGELVYFLPEILPGDLAFFGNEDGHIVHVGMMLDTERILHASGRVRIDYLDQSGIFNKERNGHTHRLQVIKRLK